MNVVCLCSSGPKKYATNLLICSLKLVGETVIWESLIVAVMARYTAIAKVPSILRA